MSDQTPPSAVAAYAPPMNTLAIVALVLSFVVSIGGIVCGHLALAQIKRTGEAGREFALAGLIIGYVITGAAVLAVIAWAVFALWYVSFFMALLSTTSMNA
jgi:hypothetical protein